MAEKSGNKDASKRDAAAERESQERYQQSIERIREGCYRFTSKVRGQASIILDELIDPEGEAISCLADIEGDVGALALAMPLDMITFETWLFGQIGDQEELDLDIGSHQELWFNFGAWIGEALRLRHGGHWLFFGDEPGQWRLGFSKVMLEVVPHMFAQQLLSMGPGAVKKMLGEIERLRRLHEDQLERDGGQGIDRFTAQHYVRRHTTPLGQWMVMDFKLLDRMWNRSAARDLAKEVRKHGKRIGEANKPVVDQIVEAISKADQEKPIGAQTGDRGLFEAVLRSSDFGAPRHPWPWTCLRRWSCRRFTSVFRRSSHRWMTRTSQKLRKGIELFALFVDVVPHKFQAEDGGFLGTIPNEDLATPYRERTTLEIGKGDWVIVNPSRFKKMLLDFDSKRLLERYDEFVKYVASNPKAPRRRDDGRMLAETVAHALVDFKGCVTAAAKGEDTLLFRLLPPPS